MIEYCNGCGCVLAPLEYKQCPDCSTHPRPHINKCTIDGQKCERYDLYLQNKHFDICKDCNKAKIHEKII